MGIITNKHLEGLIDRINIVTKNPTTSWTKFKNGNIKPNIGNYHLDEAYGGVALHQMVNEQGGVDDIFNSGYMTKRDLYNRLSAFLKGLGSY